jgi:hypothetical protein
MMVATPVLQCVEPSPADRKRLAGKLLMTDPTIVRAYREPGRCHSATLQRVTTAALELGIAPPAGA